LAVLPLLFYGSVEMTIHQYQLWFQELAIELSHKQSLFAAANHTIFSVVARYTPLGFLLINPFITRTYQVLMLVAIGILVYYFVNMKPNNKDQEQYPSALAIDSALLIAFIPLLAFTSENAFIYVQLLVVVILCNFKKLRSYEQILAILGFLFIGGNFSELIGKRLSQTLDDISLIAVGTVILICLTFILRKRKLL
jgi:hypothetical protein